MNLTTQLITAAHREEVRQLYLKLDKDSCYRRFGVALNAEAVSRYVDRLDFYQGIVVGAFHGDKLIGVCESLPIPGEEDIRELAFVVDPAYRGQQVGQLLGRAILRSAAATLVVACVADNPPMTRLAGNLGFSRVGRINCGGLPKGLVEALYTPYGLFVAESTLEPALA